MQSTQVVRGVIDVKVGRVHNWVRGALADGGRLGLLDKVVR